MDAAITTAFEQAVNRDLGFDEVRALAQSIKAGTGEPRDLAAAFAEIVHELRSHIADARGVH